MVRFSGLALGALLVFGSLTGALAQAGGGKSLTLIINYGAGGNVDIEGRVFARHIGKHVSGNPNIVINNVPGAGGLTAINQMGAGVGVKDPSTTVGFVTFNPMAILTEDPALRVKIDSFAVIAGVGAYYIVYARQDALPGARQPKDLARATNIEAAGYARSSVHDVRLRLMLDLIGAHYQVVTGFQSTSAVNLAIERNEINFMLSTLPAYETQVVPNLVAPGIAMPLWQIGVRGPDGALRGSEKLEQQGVRYFEQVYQEAHGEAPSGPTYRAFSLISELQAQLARVILMPPGASPAAIADMRRAVDDLASDPDFIDEYQRTTQEAPLFIDGARAQKLLQDAVATTDLDVKTVLRAATGLN